MLRERVPLFRERDVVLRDFAGPVERFAVVRLAAGLLRDAVVPEDLARVARAVEGVDLARDVVDLRAPVVLRAAVVLRAVLRDAVPLELVELSSAVHLPDSTR